MPMQQRVQADTLQQQQPQASNQPLLQPYEYNPDMEARITENPRQTVMLLLQSAVDKANLAKVCHQSGALVEKGFHLGRLTAILDELRNRLSFTRDTPIAYDLEELYNYVDQCVQEAVYEKDTYYLDAGIDILTEMRDTWMHMLASLGELDLKMED